MIRIKECEFDLRYQYHYDVIRANAAVSYGGLRLYNGKRDYLMQSPEEFASTLVYLERHFQSKPVKYLEIGTASNLTNSMIWNSLNIEENVILDNLECPGISESLIGNLSFKQNTVLIIGDSTSEAIQSKVKKLGYEYDLMLIDGNHEFEYITSDFEYYHQFLSADGILIFHDIDNDAVPGVRDFTQNNQILKDRFVQVASFVNEDSLNSINKSTYGSQCGIGIYEKIKDKGYENKFNTARKK